MKCPRCGSENIQFGTNTSGGYSKGKGCCGYILLGPIGLLCGGSKTKTEEFWVCQKCGNKFTAKQAQEVQQRIMKAKVTQLSDDTDRNANTNSETNLYTVTMKEINSQNKLGTIKTLREIIEGAGLKEANDMVSYLPSVIKICDSKEEAEFIKGRLESEGAIVEIIETNNQ